LYVPAAMQPFKQARNDDPGSRHRLAMLKLALAGKPEFTLEPMEIQRGGLSYTVDTLEELAPRYGGAELFLIIGEDSLNAFHTWRKPERIRELATLAVLRRNADSGGRNLPGEVVEASNRLIGVSSSEIRERIRTGKPIHGFVPESVATYIKSNGLYR